MLYRTHHHPFFFPFNPFTSSTTTTSSPQPPLPCKSSSLPSNTSSPSFIQGMECVEGALKSSFRPEMALKTTTITRSQQQQVAFDEFLTVNGHVQGGFSGEDFFVDDLLDLSTGFAEDKAEEEENEELNNNNKGCSAFVSVSTTTPQQQQQQVKSEKYCDFNEFGSLPSSELSVPADDLADLEWVSHFVDDSFPEYSLAYPAGKLASIVPESRPEPKFPAETNSCFSTPVQTKARSKRMRTGGRVWSLNSPSLTESSTSSSSSTSSTTSSLSSPSAANLWLIYTNMSQTAELFLGRPPVKKPKKKKQSTDGTGGSGGGAQQPRRCSHCGVQKTPQWRAGPLGAKTLCNACGVRFKSGRLLPEYRPACSPTFSSELHSNNHRKVLEMRRKKELEAGLAPPVQSF